jgi:hypothetical protein
VVGEDSYFRGFWIFVSDSKRTPLSRGRGGVFAFYRAAVPMERKWVGVTSWIEDATSLSKAVITFTQSKRCHMIIRGHLIYSTYQYTYISNQITI